MLKQSIPVLHAADAARAEAFYVERLGFTRRFAYRADEALADPCYQGFERDGVWPTALVSGGAQAPRRITEKRRRAEGPRRWAAGGLRPAAQGVA